MKTFYKSMWMLTAVAVASMMFTSCNNKDKEEVTSDKESMLQAAMTPYVNANVVYTYNGMANATIELYDACEKMFTNYEASKLTTADIKVAADAWEKARSFWELSEAFLYGPAANHNIDPHIDSWPLDKSGMDAMLGNAEQMAQIEADGAGYVGEKLGYGLLGFHAVEYMLYANDNADPTNIRLHTTSYTRAELVYLVAVAEDLRNQAICLEACWNGINNVTSAKKAILEEAELDGYQEMETSYGSQMINAGKAGSMFVNYQDAAEELIQGCIDIADEVGNTKIGTPCHAATDEDRNYIESPYSLNSITDFYENIVSIENSYCGMNGSASISDYVKSVNPEIDAQVCTAIKNAKDAIKAIPEPFAANATSAAAQKAVTVVGTDLVNALENAHEVLTGDAE